MKYTVGWIEWSTQPPYHRYVGVNLTWTQLDKFHDIQNTIGLAAACDYAVKVGHQEANK